MLLEVVLPTARYGTYFALDVEYATHSPYIDTLTISLVINNLWCCVANSPARRHHLTIPYDLGKAEICNLDFANSTSADALDKFPLVNFVLIFCWLWLGVRRRNEWNR